MPVTAKYVMSAAFAGLVSAFAFMSLFGGGVLGFSLGILTPLPLFYIAMTSGLTGTALATGVGFGLIAITAPLILSGGLYLFGMCLAPMLLAWRMERETGFGPAVVLSGMTIGKVLALIALVGGSGIALAFLNMDQSLADQGGVLGAARQMFYALVDQTAAGAQMSNTDLLAMKAQFDGLGTLVFVGAGASWLINAALNAGLAATLAKRAGQLGGAQMSALRLPRWFAIACAVFLMLSFTAGSPGLALTILAVTLLACTMLQGLAITHAFSRSLPARGLFLTLLYGLCLLTPTQILLALLGLADTHFDLRARSASS